MLKKSIIVIFAALTIGGAALAQGQMAAPGTQTSGLKRIPLQKFDVPPGEREAVTVVVDIAPNADVARHTHPGPETGYVIDGGLTLTIEGQPPKVLKVGDSYLIPQATPHAARGGPEGAKLMAIYIVEKGKPLALPAP